MGQVDLNFKPTVPVFDANVALGRRHDKRARVDTVEGTLEAMDQAGVDRALVYSPHAFAWDAQDGNELLDEMVRGESRLVPQYVCNPGFEDLGDFAELVGKQGVRSARVSPIFHQYPFQDWMLKPWLDWMASEGLTLWIPVSYDAKGRKVNMDPTPIHETIGKHPDLKVVLSDVDYQNANWTLQFLRSLPNVHIDISKCIGSDAIVKLINAVGDERVLFGSRFPASPMAPQLYHLHRCGLSDASLRTICSGNLERLLGSG